MHDWLAWHTYTEWMMIMRRYFTIPVSKSTWKNLHEKNSDYVCVYVCVGVCMRWRWWRRRNIWWYFKKITKKCIFFKRWCIDFDVVRFLFHVFLILFKLYIIGISGHYRNGFWWISWSEKWMSWFFLVVCFISKL